MADLVFNIAKGREAQYGSLPAAADALIAVVVNATGLEADATLKDYDTLAALLAGTTDEHTTMTRKTLTGVTVTVDDVNDRVSIDAADIVWTTPAAGPATGALLICYDPDTAVGTDADLIPVSKHDFSVTPAGVDVTAVVNTGGLVRAS